MCLKKYQGKLENITNNDQVGLKTKIRMMHKVNLINGSINITIQNPISRMCINYTYKQRKYQILK